MTDKVQNYSDVQTAELVQRYIAGETVETLAAALGKSVRSVTMKLVREGAYKKAEKAKKANTGTKAERATALAAKFELSTEAAKDLEKLTKATLEALMAS